ncbi:MAG: ribonuclease HII [bacterium]|nr:ribonuclease HII [bacterium]MCP4968780.1 ribonuclease HII [bacterium]
MASTVPQLRSANRGKSPSLRFERPLWEQGKTNIVGMDEVGRGAWAGPLTIGAAVIPQDKRIYKIRDSKMLTEGEREAIFDRLSEWCVSWAVGHASPRECDHLGMSAAMTLAARRALDGLGVGPDHLLLDGNWDFAHAGPTDLLIRGDARSLSIAAASILAKVTRDRLMREASFEFPAYAFEGNKGYPGPTHKAALHALGPSTIHRRSWVFMDNLPWSGIKREDRQQRLFD